MLSDPFASPYEAAQEKGEESQPEPLPEPEAEPAQVEPAADPPTVPTRRTWLNTHDGRRRRVTLGSAHDVRYERLAEWEEV